MPTDFQKAKRRVKLANGNWSKPISYLTSSESVEMTDGTDLQTTMDNHTNDVWSVLTETGARNGLKITAESNVINGVEFNIYYDTQGEFQYIEVIGTATATTSFTVGQFKTIKDQEYVLRGCPKGGSMRTYMLGANTTTGAIDTGEGTELINTITDVVDITILLLNGYSTPAEGLKFYPQINYKGDESTEYASYAMTNKELTDTKVDKITGKSLSTNDYTDADKIAVSSLGTASTKDVGTANGVAELDSNGKVPSSQLPSYVDDVIEGYYNSSDDRFYKESTFETVIPPEDGKSWVDIPSNKSYRWTGSVYVRVDEGVQLGETSSTAYRGDRGKTAYDHSQATGNPHGTTKGDVGLGNVDNTSDLDKPISTAVQTALNNKVDKVTGKGLSTNDYTDAEKQKNADNASAISDIQEDISQSLTATGNPLTIEASESNLVECTAEVEAVQEGSGDPSPDNIRPITGQTEVVITDNGINQWDEEWELGSIDGTTGVPVSNSNIIRSKNFNRCYSGKTYYCKASSGANVHIYYYDTFMNYISKQDGFANNTVTTPSNAVYFKIIIFGSTYNNNVSVNYPSTDHDYHAYAGKTYRVEIGQKNKLPMTVEGIKSANTSGTWNGNVYTVNGGTFTIETDERGLVTGIRANGTFNASTVFYVANFAKAGKYVLSGCPSGGSGSTYRINYPYDGTNYAFDTGNSVSFTADGNEHPVSIAIFSGYTANNLTFYPMLRTTIDDSEFVPYNPNLPEAIYGSELDVLTGKMVVDKASKTIADIGWMTVSNGSFASGDIGAKRFSQGQLSTIISSHCPTVPQSPTPTQFSISGLNWVNGFQLWNTGCTTFNELKAKYGELQVCYELATPFTIQLTPEQIRLLKGTNNISCNTGDLSIKYYPDNVLGQLKGDIESEYDERVEILESEVSVLPVVKKRTYEIELEANRIYITIPPLQEWSGKTIIPLSIRLSNASDYVLYDLYFAGAHVRPDNGMIETTIIDPGNTLPSSLAIVPIDIFYMEMD